MGGASVVGVLPAGPAHADCVETGVQNYGTFVYSAGTCESDGPPGFWWTTRDYGTNGHCVDVNNGAENGGGYEWACADADPNQGFWPPHYESPIPIDCQETGHQTLADAVDYSVSVCPSPQGDPTTYWYTQPYIGPNGFCLGVNNGGANGWERICLNPRVP